MEASEETLETFAEDVALLWTQSSVPLLEAPPDSFQFLRDHVAISRPCVIKNSLNPQVECTLDDLVARYSDSPLVVAVTPDGSGDSVRCTVGGPMFIQPEERTIDIELLRNFLRMPRTTESGLQGRDLRLLSSLPPIDDTDKPRTEGRSEGVFYYSRQNDCLRQELPDLWNNLGLPQTFQWAEEAFGTGPPDAVNLWIGNESATSSMHKDHYHNLFFVLSGEKIFTLCPPADAAFLYERSFPAGTFKQASDATWCVEPSGESVHWIEADVTRRDDEHYLGKFPLLKYTHPITVHVRAGEMLYIPALWFHRVTQSCETVGVNYWYDMNFASPEWCYFRLCQNLTPASDEAIDGGAR